MTVMKLFFVALTIRFFLVASSLLADDSISEILTHATVSGDVRYQYIIKDNDVVGGDAKGSAIGGNLGIQTTSFYGFSLGAMAYTTNRVTGSDNPFIVESKKLTNTHLLDGNSSYTIVGQAYIQYKNKDSTLKMGRQYLDTPFIGADYSRIIPNLFEAYIFTNSTINDTKITLGHVAKMAGWDSLSGDITKFVPMTQAAGITFSQNGVAQYNRGVSLASIIYSGIVGTVLEAWYYKAHDLVDIYYIEGMHTTKIDSLGLKFAAQYWHINSCSKYDQWASGTEDEQINYSVYGIMSEVNMYDTSIIVAYHDMNMRKNLPAIHGIWGSYPEYVFAQESFVTNYNISGVNAIKVGIIYNSDFGEFGAHYVIFNSHDEALENSQNVLDLIYSHKIKSFKNLEVSLVYESARVNSDSDANKDYDFYKASLTYTF